MHFFDIATSKSGPRMVCFAHFASRHNGVQFFIASVASWLRTRSFSEPTFRPSGATNHWKKTVFRSFPYFSRICIFCLLDLCSSRFVQCPIVGRIKVFHFELGPSIGWYCSNPDESVLETLFPDESVLETLFCKQVKNCKAIQYDMNEHHRADEGTENQTTISLFLPCDTTLTVRGWKQIVFPSNAFMAFVRSFTALYDIA